MPMAGYLRLLGLQLLVIMVVLLNTAQAAPALGPTNSNAVRVVISESDFASALGDPTVARILINGTTGALVLTQAFWSKFKSPILVNRTLVIEPSPDSPPLPVFDFGYVDGKAQIDGCVALAPNTVVAPTSPSPPATSPDGSSASSFRAAGPAAPFLTSPTSPPPRAAGPLPGPAAAAASLPPPSNGNYTPAADPNANSGDASPATTAPSSRRSLRRSDSSTAPDAMESTNGPSGSTGGDYKSRDVALNGGGGAELDYDINTDLRGVMVTVRGFELRRIQVRVSFGFWVSPEACEIRVEDSINHLEVAMPRPFGERFWATSTRPGLYGAHGWPQLFSYVTEFCYPNDPNRCYSPATDLWDVALVNPLTSSNGGYVLHYLRSFSHGDVNMDEECVKARAYPDCAQEALARLHGSSQPIEGTSNGASEDHKTSSSNTLNNSNSGVAVPTDNRHNRRNTAKLAIILSLAVGLPVLLIVLFACRCTNLLGRGREDFNTPLYDTEAGGRGSTADQHSSSNSAARRLRRVFSLLGSMASPAWGSASAVSQNRVAMLNADNNMHGSNGGGGGGDGGGGGGGDGSGGGGGGATMYGTGFVALLMGPDGISIGSLLGSGSFGKVFEGMWRGRRVAVKVVMTNSAEEDDKVKREVEVASQLNHHPNIVTTFTSARVGPASRTASLVPERPDLRHEHGAAATVSATAAAAATVATATTADTPQTNAVSSSQSQSDAAAVTTMMTPSMLLNSSPSCGQGWGNSGGGGGGTPTPGYTNERNVPASSRSPVANLFRSFFSKRNSPSATASASVAAASTANILVQSIAVAATPAGAGTLELPSSLGSPTILKVPAAAEDCSAATAAYESAAELNRLTVLSAGRCFSPAPVINIHAVCNAAPLSTLSLGDGFGYGTTALQKQQLRQQLSPASRKPTLPPVAEILNVAAEQQQQQQQWAVVGPTMATEEWVGNLLVNEEDEPDDGGEVEREVEIKIEEAVAAEVEDEYDATVPPYSPAPSSIVIMPVPPGTRPGTPRPPMSSASNILHGSSVHAAFAAASSATNVIGGPFTPGATPRWTPRATSRGGATPYSGTPIATPGNANNSLHRLGVDANIFDMPAALPSSSQYPSGRQLALPPRSPAAPPPPPPRPRRPAESTGETWIVMELCDGGSLATAVARGEFHSRSGALNMLGVLSILRDISRGMAYLHSRGIVHGDLKAENVMLCTRATPSATERNFSSRGSAGAVGKSGVLPVAAAAAAAAASGHSWWRKASQAGATPTTVPPLPPPLPPSHSSGGMSGATAVNTSGGGGGGRTGSSGLYVTPGGTSSVQEGGLDGFRYVAKVCDFGVSRSLDPGRTHLRTAAAGSVTHMAPETLLRGEMRREADVYAFGVLLWELVTGAKAYAGLSHGEIVQAVVLRGCRPQLPLQANPNTHGVVPEPLAELAEECWASDPEARPTFEDVLWRIDCLAMPVAVVMPAHDDAIGNRMMGGPTAAGKAAIPPLLPPPLPNGGSAATISSPVRPHCSNMTGRGGGLLAAFKAPVAGAAVDSGGLGCSSTPTLPHGAGFAGLLAHMARLAKRSQLKGNEPISTGLDTCTIARGGNDRGSIENIDNPDVAVVMDICSFSSGAAAAFSPPTHPPPPPPMVPDSDSEDAAAGAGGAFGSGSGQPQIFWRQPQLPLQTLLTLQHLPHTGAVAEEVSFERVVAQQPSQPHASQLAIFKPPHFSSDLEEGTMMMAVEDNDHDYNILDIGDECDDVGRHWDSQGSHFSPGGGGGAASAVGTAAATKTDIVTTEGEIEMAPILERISFGRMLHRMALQPSAAAGVEDAIPGDGNRYSPL